MAEENYNKYILGIIGIVAVVGLFMMITNNSQGGIETVSGEAVKMMKAQPQSQLSAPIQSSESLRRARCIDTDSNNNPFLIGEVITLDAQGEVLEYLPDRPRPGDEYKCESNNPQKLDINWFYPLSIVDNNLIVGKQNVGYGPFAVLETFAQAPYWRLVPTGSRGLDSNGQFYAECPIGFVRNQNTLRCDLSN